LMNCVPLPTSATSARDSLSAMSRKNTRAFCATKLRTISAPIPEPPPVTTTVFLASEGKIAVVIAFSGPGIARFDLGVELDGSETLFARIVAGLPCASERHVIVHASRRQIRHDHARAHVAREMPGVFE